MENPEGIIKLSRESSVKSFLIEPEMEDASDKTLLKNLIKELDIEESLKSSPNPLLHNASSPNICIHCKLLKKLSSLNSDLSKITRDIYTTHEILTLKRQQNCDLKAMIKRLEARLSKIHEESLTHKSSNPCSCANRCIIC